MADNYLEKKMDDFRNGRLAPSVGRKRRLPMKGRCFFVAGGATPERRGIVEQLRRDGATVVFSGPDDAIADSLVKVYGAVSLQSLASWQPDTLSSDIYSDPIPFLRSILGKDFDPVS